MMLGYKEKALTLMPAIIAPGTLSWTSAHRPSRPTSRGSCTSTRKVSASLWLPSRGWHRSVQEAAADVASHRPSLLKYHNRHLRLGDAPSASAAPSTPGTTPSTPLAAHGWQLTTLTSSTAEEQLELSAEIARLEHVLESDVGAWTDRLAIVKRQLSANPRG